MAEINDDLMSDLVENINRLVKAFNGGAGNSPIGNSKAKMPTLPKLSTALHQSHRTVKLMHGGVEDVVSELESLAYGLKHKGVEVLAVIGTIGTMLTGAFRGIMSLNTQFGKMADIGQVFQGSLFEMARSAGKAGLSVDQYTKFLTKNSMVTSAIGAKSMGVWQMSVRKALEPMGNFGLSLEEIDDVVSDYGETMRQTGVLSKLNESQRTKAVADMIDQASQMAGVFGRSRTEIMKTTNEAMRQTNFAGRVQTGSPEQAAAARAYVTAFAGMSDTLAKTYAEQYGKGGYTDTDLGKALIGSALGDINTVIQSGIDQAKAGIMPTSKKIASDFNYIYNRFNKTEMNRLESLSKTDENSRKTLEFAVQFRANFDKFKNMDVDAMARYIDTQRELQRQRDAITKSAGVFEDTFKTITGSFMEGFYGALEKMLGSEGSEQLKVNLGKLGDVAGKAGRSIGEILGWLLSPQAIHIYNELLDEMVAAAKVIGQTIASPEGQKTIKNVWSAFKYLASGFVHFAEWIASWTGGSNNANDPDHKSQTGLGSWLPQLGILSAGLVLKNLLSSAAGAYMGGAGTAGLGKYAFGGVGSRLAGVLTGGMLKAPFTIAKMFVGWIPIIGPILKGGLTLLEKTMGAVGEFGGSVIASAIGALVKSIWPGVAGAGIGGVLGLAGMASLAGLAGWATYKNVQNGATAAEIAKKQGYTVAIGDDGYGAPTQFQNPKTGDVQAAMAFDPRYAKALGSKSRVPATPTTPASPGSSALGAVAPYLPNDDSLPDPSGIFKMSDDYWAKLAKSASTANPVDPATETVELLKKLVYLQAVQVRQQKDVMDGSAIMAAEAQRYKQ